MNWFGYAVDLAGNEVGRRLYLSAASKGVKKRLYNNNAPTLISGSRLHHTSYHGGSRKVSSKYLACYMIFVPPPRQTGK